MVAQRARFWSVVRGNIATRAEMAGWWALFSGGAAGEVADEDRDFVVQALGMLPPRPWDEGTWAAWTGAV